MSCLKPISIINPHWSEATNYNESQVSKWLVVPCGHCPGCLIDKRNDWTNRIQMEASLYSLNIFFTLTYDEINEPWTCLEDSYPLPSVSKSDVQKFLKRIRSYLFRLCGRHLRYVIVSEYGPRTFRPHYHGILFDWPVGVSYIEAFAKCWRLGIFTAEPLKDGGAAYCSKYLFKKQPPGTSGFTPCFLLASRKPALGYDYLTPKQIQFYNEEKTDYMRTIGGRKIKMPRYIRTKHLTEETRRTISERSRNAASERFENEFNNFLDSYDDACKAISAIRKTRSGRWSQLQRYINQINKKDKRI